MASKNDFKLKVGLDVTSKTVAELNAEIQQLQSKVKPLTIQATLALDAEMIKTAVANVDKSLPPVKLKVDVNTESLEAFVTKVSKKLNISVNPSTGTTKQSSGGKASNSTSNLNIDKTAKRLQTMASSVQKMGGDALTLLDRITALNKELDALNANGNVDLIKEGQEEKIQEIVASMADLEKVFSEAKTKSNQTFFDEAQLAKLEAARNKIKELVSQYPKLLGNSDFAKRYNEILHMNFNTMEKGKTTVATLTRKMSGLHSEMKQSGDAVDTLGKRFGTIFKNVSLSTIATALVQNMKRAFVEMANNVKELDHAMTELKKVTDATNATYSQFFDDAKVQAQEVGAALSDVITSTADFARLGYSIGEATDLAKAAQIYYNVGDGFSSITEASESVISTMKAFGIETKDVMQIVDAFNTTGNNFAISTQGVGEAMKRSASALASANNNMYESIALITAANSVVQDPAVVGTAMKTLSLRIRGATADLEQAGLETDGMALSTAKLREEVLALTGMKVDIMLNEDEFKSTFNIMQELSKVWKDIADVDQAALLELLGGKRQANVLSSMLTNFNVAEEALAKSLNSTGSAVAENEKYLDSIQGKLNQLQAAWESLSASVIDSELFKGLIDIVTSVVKALDSIISVVGSVETALGAVFVGGVTKSAITGYLAKLKAGHGAAMGLSAAASVLSTSLSAVAVSALAIVGIKLAKWFYDVALSTNKAMQIIDEGTSQLQALTDNEDSVHSLAQRFDELTNKTQKTAEEQQELYDVQNQLKNLIPELNGYYNAQNDFIITECDSVEELIGKYDGLIEKKRQAIATAYYDENFMGLSPYKEDFKAAYNASHYDKQTFDAYTEAEAKYAADYENPWKRALYWLPGAKSWLFGDKDYDVNAFAQYAFDRDVLFDGKSAKDWQMSQSETYNTSMGSMRSQLMNKLLADPSMRYVSSKEQNAMIEALQGASLSDLSHFKTYSDNQSATDTIKEIKSTLPAYADIVSGRLDNLSPEARNAVIDLGGLEKVNKMMDAYKGGQKDIIAGTSLWYNSLDDATKAALEAYRGWIEAQSEGQKTISETSVPNINISDFSKHKDAVNSLGEAYVQFLEDGKVSLDALAELQETFGSYTDEWDNLMTTLSSDDSTASDVKKSVEDLAEAYLDNKLALGEVTTQNKAHIQSMLEQIGVKNAKAVVDQAEQQTIQATAIAIAQEIDAEEENIQTTEELQKAVLEACIAKGMEEGLAQKVAESLGEETAVKKAAAMDKSFRDATQEEIDKLIEELALVKANATEIAKLQRVKAARAAIEQAESTGTWTPQIEAEQEWLNQFYDQVDKAQNEKVVVEIDMSETDSVGKYAKDAAGKVSDAFQKMYDELQFMREANLISEAEYLSRLAKLNEQYNKNNLATYRKYALEIFNGMKANMKENLTEQYDAEIEAIEEEIDALNDKKEETEKYYDDLIEAEQDKLDLLKEEWETEEYLLKIEQARAALAKAQQQKSVRIYREGRGFAWEQDQEAVHDAQTEVNEAIQEYNRYLQELAIEKQIEKLEKLKEAAIETIEEQIKALEKAKEAAQKAKEQALKDLEEMKFNGEMFLQFLEESGIKIDEDLKKVIASFTDLSNMSADELKALEDALGETEGSVEGFGETFQNVLLETGEDVEGFDGKVSNLQDTINNLEGKNIEIKVTTKYVTEGTPSPYSKDVVINVTSPDPSPANKIAKQLPADKLGINDVPAFASGVINLPRSVNALTDELGPELVIPGQGTFRKLKMGTSVLPADISKNLWTIGQNPVGFASGIASMISNKQEENKVYQMTFGNIELPNVHNARDFTNELKSLVLKAEQLAYSK